MEIRALRLIAVAILLTQLGVDPLQAQESRPIRVYVAGGMLQAIGDFREYAETGYGGSLGLGLAPRSLSASGIELVLRGQYDRYSSEGSSRPDITFASVGLDWKFNRTGRQGMTHYLVLGGGFSNARWSSFETAGMEIGKVTENNFYLSPGLGLEFRASGLSPFVQARLVYVSGKLIEKYYSIRAFGGIKF